MVEIRCPVPYRHNLRTEPVRAQGKGQSYKYSVQSNVAKAAVFLAETKVTHKALESVCTYCVLSQCELSAKPTKSPCSSISHRKPKTYELMLCSYYAFPLLQSQRTQSETK